MLELKIKLTFTDPILGSAPANPDIYEEYVASKAPDKSVAYEEAASLDTDLEKEKKKMTIFLKTEDGVPFLRDYQIKGFFKDACGALRRVDGTASNKVKSYKQVIDKLIFVSPTVIPIISGNGISECQRPLRVPSPLGERTAIAISEEVAAGAQIEFSVQCLDDSHAALVREWLDYGKFSGLGQWRNSGKGRFTWEELGVISDGPKKKTKS